MKIKEADLSKWKKNTLSLARELSLDEEVLNLLDNTQLEVIPQEFRGRNFYGWARYNPPKIEVYEANPSKYLPKKFQEVWNQSGMDHELIGHIYNYFYGKDKSGNEKEAIETQIKLANYRGRKDPLWKLAAISIPFLTKFKEIRNNFYTKSNTNLL
ncbi:MAG: hypothetical protein JSW73_04955 [Candidatus Woesearchaeota archaeon]|nr:MAG: hypothetical protein JSW73_04955 [Candidatus Woesearchaeota archaeon]